jgi:hypothetical protein
MKLLTSKPTAMNVTATGALLLALRGPVGRPGDDDAGACNRDPGHRRREPLAERHHLDRSVAQTLKQIQQYQTQLQQYENMLQNTLAPAAYIWDAATSTMNQLRSAIDTLNYYKTNLGSIDAYLGKFQDTAYYRSSPCFKEGGCTARTGPR